MEEAQPDSTVESLYIDENGAVKSAAIIEELNPLNAGPPSFDAVDDNFENSLDVEISIDEEDVEDENTESVDDTIANLDEIEDRIARRRETPTTPRQMLMGSGPPVNCQHHETMEAIQTELSHKLCDFAFRMENIRPILTRANYEMPQRFHQSTNVIKVDNIDLMACERFCRMLLARNASHSNQILRDFGRLQIGSIDLIFQIIPQEIGEDLGRQGEMTVNDAPIEISDWRLLSMASVKHMMECRRSGAFTKPSHHKMYCRENCINFCGFAVVELPLYPMGCCVPSIDDAHEHEAMSIASPLQKRQHEVHEELVQRIRSKLNAWHILDLKKIIDYSEIEYNIKPFRSWDAKHVSADDAVIFSSNRYE